MLRQYLKHNRWFRTVFALPLAIRRRLLNRFTNTVDQIYRQAVVGGKIIVRPNNLNGRFRISATSDLAKRVVTTGVFEPDVTSILERLLWMRGDIINIGANVGFYAVFIAQTFPNARKVYAIEPNPEAYDDLKWNILENGCGSKIEALQICIGEVAGEVEFSLISGMPEYSSIGQIVHSATNEFTKEKIRVNVVPLVDVFAAADLEPVLIFVDSEGAELLIFRGAQKILEKWGPMLLFECDDFLLRKFGHSSAMLERYLKSIGYIVRDAIDPRHSLQHPFVGEAIALRSNSNAWKEILQERIAR